MAVGICIEDDPQSPHVDFLDDDPIYWFLFPYFEEMGRETGQMIDLYDNARIEAEHLLHLFLILQKAERDAQARGDSWHVTIGYRNDKPLEMTAVKSDVLTCIRTLKSMLNEAYDRGLSVICSGD